MDAPVEIVRGDGTVVTVAWPDRVDHISAQTLRAACPCAGCGGAAVAPPGTLVAAIRPVGGYAIGFTFAPDGHATGIYHYELLRSLAEPH